MRFARTASLLAMFLILSNSASAESPKTESIPRYLKTLQGKWKVVESYKNGTSVDSKTLANTELTLTIEEVTVELSSKNKTVFKYRLIFDMKQERNQLDLLRLDETGKPVKVKTLKPTLKGPPEVIGEREVTMRAIFEVRGKQLRICMPANEADDRPMTMDGAEKSKNSVLWVLEK